MKDLLSYVKPKPLQFQLSGINDALEKTFSLCIPKAKNQHIAIENQVGKEIPDILMDLDYVPKFLNIIINAIQSMPNGGSSTTICIKEEPSGSGR